MTTIAAAPFSTASANWAPRCPAVVEITRRHKQDMTHAVAALMRASVKREEVARAIALAIDGAIVQSQFLETPAAALDALGWVLKALRPRVA